MELVLSRTSNGLELELGFCKTSCVVSVSRRGQVTESKEGGQAILRGYFKPFEELKDCKNMVELDIRTNNIVSFGFLDEMKYWIIEKHMVDFKVQTKCNNNDKTNL
jgi:hypothetical protein